MNEIVFPHNSLLRDIIPELQSIINGYYKIYYLCIILQKYEENKDHEGYYITLTSLADEGCEFFQKKLVKDYMMENDKVQDYKITYACYRSNRHKSYSCNYLGWMYINGLCVQRDISLAKKYFLESVKMNNPVAMYNLAYFFDDDKVELFKKASEMGLAGASCALGNIYVDGIIVEQNYNIALKYYNDAIEQGHIYISGLEKKISRLKVLLNGE